MKGLFIKAESMCCTQHMENNDAEKLRSLVVNDKDRSRIMADIYIYIYIYIYVSKQNFIAEWTGRCRTCG